MRTAPIAHRIERLRAGIVDLVHVRAVNLAPVAGRQRTDCERVGFASRRADPIAIVLDYE